MSNPVLKKFVPYVGAIIALVLLALLVVTSLILRKPPSSPSAEELLASIKAQGVGSDAWDFSMGNAESFVFERMPYENKIASFSANSVTLFLKEPLVQPLPLGRVLAAANGSVSEREILLLNELHANITHPTLAPYVDSLQLPAFEDTWSDVHFLSEIHSVDEFIEFSISGDAYWGDNYVYGRAGSGENEEREAAWFFTPKSVDGERTKAPQVDGFGDLVGSIFTKIFPGGQPSNVILNRPELKLKADASGILNNYNLNWITYETNEQRAPILQSLKPLSSFRNEAGAKVRLLNFTKPGTLEALATQLQQTAVQQSHWVDYAQSVSRQLAADVDAEYQAAQDAAQLLDLRLVGTNRFALLSDKQTGRESVVILSPDQNVALPMGYNSYIIELYDDFANVPAISQQGSLADLQPTFSTLYELLRSVEVLVEQLSDGSSDAGSNYQKYPKDLKRGYQIQLNLPSVTKAGEGQIMNFTTVEESGVFQLNQPFKTGAFELNLSDESNFTSTVKLKIDELTAMIVKASTELAALEERKAKLLGPVNLGNILQGEIIEKNGSKRQQAWVEVVEIRESTSGQEGLFDLAMSFRAPEDPSVQLIAKGSIDMRSDSEGIVKAFIKKDKQVANLERSKRMLESLLDTKPEAVTIVNETTTPVQEQVWNPSETDYAITLVPDQKEPELLQQVRIVGKADKRILLSVEPTTLAGESQSANLSLGSVDQDFLNQYNSEMKAIREATPVSAVFADNSKQLTFDLSSSSKLGTTQILKGWAYERNRSGGTEMTAYAAPSLRGQSLQPVLVTDAFSAGRNEDWTLNNGRWQRAGSASHFAVDRMFTDLHNKRGTGLYALNRTTNRPILLANSTTINGQKEKTLLDAVGNLGAVTALGGKLTGNDGMTRGGASAVAVSNMQGDERSMEYRVETDPTQLSLGLSDRIFYVTDGNPLAFVKAFNVKGGSIFSSKGYKLQDETSLPSVRQWSSKVFEITLPSKKGKYVLTRGNPRSGSSGIIIELE